MSTELMVIDQTASESDSGKEFMKDFATPTPASVDTPVTPDPAPASSGSFNPLATPPSSPAPVAADKPIFEDTELQPDPGSPDAKPLTNKKSEAKLKFIIKMVDKMQSKGFSRLAKDMDEKRWRFDEEEMEALIDAWMPYMQEHGGKIPDWIEAAFTTLWIFGNRTWDAFDVRRVNVKNEKAAGSSAVANAVAAVAATPAGARKNYTLATTVPGYYQCDAKSGVYLSKAKILSGGAKADLADIELILKDNDLETVRAAFPNVKLPDAA